MNSVFTRTCSEEFRIVLLYSGIQLYIHVQGCIVVIDEGININIQCLAYFGPYFVKFCMTHAIYVHVPYCI